MSPAVAGVIFDLDGTLTAPGAIRFDRIRERIGMDGGGSIMAWIAAHARDEAERQRMEAVVVEEERVALDRMALGPGFDALAAAIVARGGSLRTGICTRNNREALQAFDALLRRSGHPPAERLFQVQLARTHRSPRLGRVLADKPSHEPVHEIVHTWGLEERFTPTVAHEHAAPRHPELLFVGDDVDDCLSARRAGVRSGWIHHGRRTSAPAGLHRTVDQHFEDLAAVAEELSRPPRSG